MYDFIVRVSGYPGSRGKRNKYYDLLVRAEDIPSAIQAGLKWSDEYPMPKVKKPVVPKVVVQEIISKQPYILMIGEE